MDALEEGASTVRTASGAKAPLAVTIATALTVAIVSGYAFVSATFTLPESPAHSAVSDVFSPYFSQRWNVFAPNILKADSKLQIQVQWREDGELVHSDWVSVGDIEIGASDGHPMPSRIVKSSLNAAAGYRTRYNALTGDQKERVRDTFIEALGGGRFAPFENVEIIDQIDALGESRSAVVRFMRYDYMLQRFASAFGQAYFDRDVERVRWRIEVDRPNDFDHRFDDEKQFETSYTTFGWRQPALSPDPDVVALYSDVLERYAR